MSATLSSSDASKITSSVLFLGVGLPTWALVDGTWAVLASIAAVSPQGFAISTYLTLSLTLGNIVPLIVGQMMKTTPFSKTYNMISYILCIGFSCGLLMSFFWNRTISIGRDAYSLPLYFLFFLVGSCSSTSNVTHYIFVSKFSRFSTTLLSTGMALGSMVAGLLGLAQGLWLVEYGFSVFWYFLLLTSLYIVAFLSLTRIKSNPNFSPLFEEEEEGEGMDRDMIESEKRSPENSFELGLGRSRVGRRAGSRQDNKNDNDYNDDSNSKLSNSDGADLNSSLIYPQFEIPQKCKIYFLFHLINSICGYGIVPSLISVTSSKFNGSIMLLQLATGISCSLDPVGRFFTGFVRINSTKAFAIATCCILVLTLTLFSITAGGRSSSDYDSSYTTFYNGSYNYVPILLYVGCNVLFGYVNTSMFILFKELLPDTVSSSSSSSSQVSYPLLDQQENSSGMKVNSKSNFDPKQSYRMLGMISQAGAMIGSIFTFLLVFYSVL